MTLITITLLYIAGLLGLGIIVKFIFIETAQIYYAFFAETIFALLFVLLPTLFYNFLSQTDSNDKFYCGNESPHHHANKY